MNRSYQFRTSLCLDPIRSSSFNAPRGVSLVDLMVSIGIVGILMSLFAPAVQSARESARRMTCREHLRQIGQAMYNYESAHATFPPGSLLSGWSFKTMLLPFLDDAASYREIVFENDRMLPEGYYSCVPESARLILLGIDPEAVNRHVFYCPTDPRAGVGGRRLGSYLGMGANFDVQSPLTYPYIYPEQSVQTSGSGMLSLISSVRPAAVRDGMSMTLFVGERGIHQPKVGTATFSSDLCGMGEGESWIRASVLRPGIVDDLEGHLRFWSHHPGGVNFLFGDGHVQFLSYAMSDITYRALSTGAGNEVVGEF